MRRPPLNRPMMPGLGPPPFAEVSNIQFFADDRIFSSQDVSIFQEVMGDITAEEMKVPEEQFLNVEVINEADMNVIKSLVENGSSLQFLSDNSTMWPSPQDNVILDIEVITSTDDDDEPIYTDLDSRGSSGDDYSDYGSESGTDQNSDMDLSQRSIDITPQQLEILQNFARSNHIDYGQLETRQHNYIQDAPAVVGNDVIKREPSYQLPSVKLEPNQFMGEKNHTASEIMDYNHNEQFPNNCVKVENIYPQGVIPSVVTSDDDDVDDGAVDSGTDSCDSKDSETNNKRGERKRPGRKKGQVSKVYHLWEFIRDMLADPRYCPNVIKWENEEEGIFRVIQSETVASLWGAKKNNRTKMTYEKMSRSIRYSRKEGYFADIPKNRGYPKKLCFKFGGKAHGWRRQVK